MTGPLRTAEESRAHMAAQTWLNRSMAAAEEAGPELERARSDLDDALAELDTVFRDSAAASAAAVFGDADSDRYRTGIALMILEMLTVEQRD